MAIMKEDAAEVYRIFEYLLAVKNLTQSFVSRVDEFEGIWDLNTQKMNTDEQEHWLYIGSQDPLYAWLFSIYQRLQREGYALEFAFGWGQLQCIMREQAIKRPLFITPIQLLYDSDKGIFTLAVTDKGTYIEMDLLHYIGVEDRSRIDEFTASIELGDIDPRNRKKVGQFLQKFIKVIHPEGIYLKEECMDEQYKTVPIITYCPMLLLRKINECIWQNELNEVMQYIKNGYPIPTALKMLVTLDCSREQSLIEEYKDIEEEDILFPLPANREQMLIIKKIYKNPAVIVQGPPGTGKSHTLANLICHFLAQGKKILITSEKEQALRVIRNKLPEEIRSLCVSVLNGKGDSLKDLEECIQVIAQNMDTMQEEILQEDIDILRKRLKKSNENMQKYEKKLQESNELHDQKIRIETVEMMPIEVGKWLHAHEQYNWIPDEITSHCPLSEQEMEMLFSMIEEFHPKDLYDIPLHRPKTMEVPSPITFKENVLYITALQKQVEKNESIISEWSPIKNAYHHMHVYKNRIRGAIEFMQQDKAPWMYEIIKQRSVSDDRVLQWRQLLNELVHQIQMSREVDQQLSEIALLLPENVDYTQIRQDLYMVLKRFEEQKTLGWIFKNFTGRKYLNTVGKVKINGYPIRSEEDIEMTLNFIDNQEMLRKCGAKWNEFANEIGESSIDISTPHGFTLLQSKVNEVVLFLNHVDEMMIFFQEMRDALCIMEPPKWADVQWLQKVYVGIETIEAKKKWEEASGFLKQGLKIILKGSPMIHVHECWDQLREAYESRDIEKYEKTYKELLRLEYLEKKYPIYVELLKRLGKVAPLWVKRLVSKKENMPKVVVEWQAAWQWKLYYHKLQQIHEKCAMEEIHTRCKREIKIRNHIVKDLVVKSAWLSQIQRVTPMEKRSLYAWMKAIQRIGKGTGKHAKKYRREANQEMKICKGAVPIWIMPIQKVIEMIPLTSEPFDLVIIDESSQSDLFSLSVLLRGKKTIIVGDENQISPENIGIKSDDVYMLIQHFLSEIPQKDRFEMKASLYEMANQVFDAKVALKEHFRCIPEIIQFSNQFMYQNRIIPLRITTADQDLYPPLQSIYVPTGRRIENSSKIINQNEADALIEHIAKCCKDHKYKGRTMGVISLQSTDQAKWIEEKLRKEVGEEEMIQRQLLCGDAYCFQGDERDVIFMSMVAAPNMKTICLNKRGDYQRFNVAASRAKEQMFLFHSISLENLHPPCARYHLLEYFQANEKFYEIQEEREYLLESQLEEDVYEILQAWGYSVIPHVKVGSYYKTIDMVVEGSRSKLAIECDGDRSVSREEFFRDIEYQQSLERVGWTFYRIQGSQFYLNREQVVKDLLGKLQQMGIEPTEKKVI